DGSGLLAQGRAGRLREGHRLRARLAFAARPTPLRRTGAGLRRLALALGGVGQRRLVDRFDQDDRLALLLLLALARLLEEAVEVGYLAARPCGGGPRRAATLAALRAGLLLVVLGALEQVLQEVNSQDDQRED